MHWIELDDMEGQTKMLAAIRGEVKLGVFVNSSQVNHAATYTEYNGRSIYILEPHEAEKFRHNDSIRLWLPNGDLKDCEISDLLILGEESSPSSDNTQKISRPISDDTKLEVIVGLALRLAQCAPRFETNGKPNQTQIAKAVAELIGLPEGTIRNTIGEALKQHS
jgi:hypothetical protein